MTVDPIVTVEDPPLRKPSLPVGRLGPEIRDLVRRMSGVLARERGLGLAAVQIGVPLRVVVTDAPDGRGHRLARAWINPEILWASPETRIGIEGCLSMRGVEAPVERARRIRVRYQDVDGRPCELEADGLLAVCLQHEIDHLDGKLFTDRISQLRRDQLRRAYAKLLRMVGRS